MQTESSRKKKIFIQANCQSHAIKNIFLTLKRLEEKYDILTVKPVHLWKEEDKEEIFEKIHEADIFLHQPIFEVNFGIFASDNLAKHLKADAITISFPNLYFTGYHPQAMYLKGDKGKKVDGPFEYHDKNIVDAYKNGKSVEDVKKIFLDEDFYSPKEIEKNIEQSLKDLEGREKFTTIKMSPTIRNRMKGKKLFHIFNHPTNEMIFSLMNKILKRLDEDLLVYAEMQQFPNEMLGQIKFPVYKSVQKYFGIEEETNLMFFGKEYMYEEMIDEFFRFYDSSIKPWREKEKNMNNNIVVYGINFLRLEIPVDKKVKSIKISLSEFNFLQLSSIYLKINKKWKKINENRIADAQQSSLHKNDERFDISNVIENNSSFFSTKKENAPWVKIEFKKTLNIEKIGLVNTAQSPLWNRANSINVSISEDTVSYNKIFDATDELSKNILIQNEIEGLEDSFFTDPKLKAIKEQLDNLDKSSKMNNISLMSKDANYLVETFYSLLEDDYDLLLKNKDWCINICKNILFPILNIHPKIILLLIAMAIIDKKNKEAFLIYKYCSEDLSIDEKEEIHQLIYKIGNVVYGYPLILGTHNIVRPIRSWPQQLLLNTLYKIQKACAIDEVIDSFVCYGTLLGIYRDGDFIEYDDDMDMLIVLENKINIDEVVHILVKELEKMKLKSHVAKTNKQKIPFIQVFDSEHQVWTDIFIGFIENDEISLPMQNVNYFSIPKNSLFPRQQLEFGGFTLNVPNNIPEFLEYRYGKNWKTPDRHFRNSEQKLSNIKGKK